MQTTSEHQIPSQQPPWENDGLRFHVLGSGSHGNCCVIECPDGMLLIDAGLSCRQIFVRMADLGLDPARIQAILITHEHSDHIGGLRVTAQKLGVPIYASYGTLASAEWSAAGDLSATPLAARQSFTLCGIDITPFHVPHDAAETFGYRFERAGDTVGYCADLGCVTEEAGTYLSDVRILALESNHDPELLRTYDGYPAILKARIASDSGHLSNDQCATAMTSLTTSATCTMIAMHISQHTNLPSLCRAALEESRQSLEDVAERLQILVASQTWPFTCL